MQATTIVKILFANLALVLILGNLPVPGTASAEPAAPEAAASGPGGEALDAFRALAGQWRGSNQNGQEVRVSYQVVAGGSAVLERLDIADHPDMLTLYHLDGDDLMLTHYCAAANQPRMRSAGLEEGPEGELARFDFVDVTGLVSPDAGHMHHALFRFQGPDRLTSEWTWREAGEDRFTVVTRLERVPSAAR